VRAVLVPDDFGLLGHYRASALETNRARAPVYAGQAACAECHGDVVEARRVEGHARISCESCHGALAAHAAGAETPAPVRPDGRTLCVRCHAANTGKPSWYRTVVIADHADDGRCVECHAAHAPRIK
jgi:predicted CXXCH cytochrome family protein